MSIKSIVLNCQIKSDIVLQVLFNLEYLNVFIFVE